MQINNKLNFVKELFITLKCIDGLDLYIYLQKLNFFECPASAKYHGNYKGGLLDHSINVYLNFHHFNELLKLNLDDDDIIISSFCHDLCKCGLYINTPSGYIFNKNHPKGHGSLSLKMLKDFNLSDKQNLIIKYHMGIYGAIYPGSYINEYEIIELIEMFNKYKSIKVFYLCDELSSIKECAENEKI